MEMAEMKRRKKAKGERTKRKEWTFKLWWWKGIPRDDITAKIIFSQLQFTQSSNGNAGLSKLLTYAA